MELKHSWQKECVHWGTLTFITSGALYWMKQPFKNIINSMKNGISPKWAFSDCTRNWNCVLRTIVFVKNFFKVNFSIGFLDFPHLRWSKNLFLMKLMVKVACTSSFCFVFSKYLDYMQYYMMLLEQCRHIAAKVQDTVSWLEEDQRHVCLVTWLDNSFAFT